MQIENKHKIPAFTVYLIESGRCCYQSKLLKMIVEISGPYYDPRQQCSLEPHFNIKLTEPKSTSKPVICHQLHSLMKTMIVGEKYSRQVFDITFDILTEESQQYETMLSAMVSLTCFACLTNGVQIKSAFSCCALWMVEDSLIWDENELDLPLDHTKVKSLMIAVEGIRKATIMCRWKGEFSYLHHKKLANLLLDANEYLIDFIIDKAKKQIQSIVQ